MSRVIPPALLAVVIATFLQGCGGDTLRTEDEVDHFVSDIASGGSLSDWKLADDASAGATVAWLNRVKIESVGDRLREDGPEWACKTAERVDSAKKIVNGVKTEIDPRERSSIVFETGLAQSQFGEVEALIDEILQLGVLEANDTVAAVCGAAKQL